MKTITNMKGTKGFAVIAFALASIIMSGCGKSDNGTPAPVAPYGGYGAFGACSACGGMSQPFVSTVGADSYPEALQLQLFTTQAYPSGVYQGGAYQNYGQQMIGAQGQFIIPAGDPNCGIAPGTYTVSGQGTYNGSQTVTNMTLTGTGPSQVTITITHAYISLSSQGYPMNTGYPNPYPYPSPNGLNGMLPSQTRFLADGYLNNNPNCGFALN